MSSLSNYLQGGLSSSVLIDHSQMNGEASNSFIFTFKNKLLLSCVCVCVCMRACVRVCVFTCIWRLEVHHHHHPLLFFTLIFECNFISISEYYAYMYVCVPSVCLVPRGQKKMLDPINLELNAVVRHHVSAGNPNQALSSSSHPSTHILIFETGSLLIPGTHWLAYWLDCLTSGLWGVRPPLPVWGCMQIWAAKCGFLHGCWRFQLRSWFLCSRHLPCPAISQTPTIIFKIQLILV